MSLLSVLEVAQLIDTNKYPQNQEEIDRIQQKTNLSDKLYMLEPKVQWCCAFCLEYAPKLIKCACGCNMCQSCLFGDLPAIPLGRCPFCTSSVNYNILPNNQCVQFNFGPTGQQLNEATLSVNKTMKICELYPQREVIQQSGKGARLLCRNHEALVGSSSTCSFVTVPDDSFQTYLQHIETCNQNNQIENRHRYPSRIILEIEQTSQFGVQNIPQLNQTNDIIIQNATSYHKSLSSYQRSIQPQLLSYKCGFGPQEVQLFSQNIFQKSKTCFYLHPHRSPVIPCILTRELQLAPNITEECIQLISHRPDYWNVQALIMANPLEPQDLRSYTQIIACLRIILPNGTTNDYTLDVCISKLLNMRVLRFMSRINPRMPGLYQFELRIKLQLDDIVFYSHVKRFRIASIFGDKPTYITKVLQQQQFSQTKLGQKLNDAIRLLEIGQEMFKLKKNAEQQENSFLSNEQSAEQNVISKVEGNEQHYILSIKDIKSILVFGSNANTLQDVCNFLLGIRGFCIVSLNTRQLIASSAFDIVSQLIDKYYNIYIVQRLITDLFYEIVQQQGDLNIVLLKVPGLFGKLRRVRETLDGEDDNGQLASNVEKLLDGLFRVSIFSQYVDNKGQQNSDKVSKNVDAPPENTTQPSENTSEQNIKSGVHDKTDTNNSATPK